MTTLNVNSIFQARNALGASRRGEFFQAEVWRSLYHRSLTLELGTAKAAVLIACLKRICFDIEADYCINSNQGAYCTI